VREIYSFRIHFVIIILDILIVGQCVIDQVIVLLYNTIYCHYTYIRCCKYSLSLLIFFIIYVENEV